MKGADQYCKIFKKPEQFGKIFVVPGSHARGDTFHIYILPRSDKLKQGVMPWTVKDSIEVYGIISGQPGWTEVYGWLHRGKWEDDFSDIYKTRKTALEKKSEDAQNKIKKEEALKKSRISTILSSY